MYGVIRMKYGYPEYESAPAVIFSDFYDYVKADKDISRVVIPQTYYGYGASLVDRANSEWLERHYPRAIKNVCYNVTISRWKFLHASGEELRELIQGLAEDYPLIDEEIHSRLEAEAKQEAFNSWAASDIDPDLEPEQLEDVMAYTGLIPAVWELLKVDSDGATIYADKEDIALMQRLIQELSANQ